MGYTRVNLRAILMGYGNRQTLMPFRSPLGRSGKCPSHRHSFANGQDRHAFVIPQGRLNAASQVTGGFGRGIGNAPSR